MSFRASSDRFRQAALSQQLSRRVRLAVKMHPSLVRRVPAPSDWLCSSNIFSFEHSATRRLGALFCQTLENSRNLMFQIA